MADRAASDAQRGAQGNTLRGMTAPTHVYLTAHGQFVSGAWAGESAQFGLRLPVMDTDSAPARGTTFTPTANGDVVADQGSQSGTHGSLTRTFSFRMGGAGSVANWDAGVQIDCAEDVYTFLDTIKSYMHTSFKWTHVKQCPIGADGRALAHSSVYQYTTGVTGTASNLLPPQCALAISMRAPIIGRRGRGRIYLPAVSAGVIAADATISATPASNIRTAMATLIANLEDTPGPISLVPCVAVMSADSSSAVRPSQVRTGNRIDTIKSRREGIAEVYTSLDLT